MTDLTGTYETANASKYLQQLCKHFAHKIDVRFSETEGNCSFLFGTAQMLADEAKLKITFQFNADAPANASDMAKHVIDSHLVKFAFRESFETMVWRDHG